jgi:hypothetical protein
MPTNTQNDTQAGQSPVLAPAHGWAECQAAVCKLLWEKGRDAENARDHFAELREYAKATKFQAKAETLYAAMNDIAVMPNLWNIT